MHSFVTITIVIIILIYSFDLLHTVENISSQTKLFFLMMPTPCRPYAFLPMKKLVPFCAKNLIRAPRITFAKRGSPFYDLQNQINSIYRNFCQSPKIRSIHFPRRLEGNTSLPKSWFQQVKSASVVKKGRQFD